jgi:L-threonylcarbamoyladenylate synthase
VGPASTGSPRSATSRASSASSSANGTRDQLPPAGAPTGVTGALSPEDARALERCVARGGVAVFPADTVYGLCCDPASEQAVARVYELKGRPATRSSAVMFFALARVLAALPELAAAERSALESLLPGGVTLLLPNRERRFRAACAADPSTVGLRVPRLPATLAALTAVEVPVMQTSANISGAGEARRLQEVPRALLDGADLALDGGELPGVPSTVVDLRAYASSGRWEVLRKGAVPRAHLVALLGGTD